MDYLWLLFEQNSQGLFVGLENVEFAEVKEKVSSLRLFNV